MTKAPLLALYVTILLAISIAAWADGCQTAYPAYQTPGGSRGGLQPPPDPNCYNPGCTAIYEPTPNNDCANSQCVAGTCDNPPTAGWCTGGDSPWTQTVWQNQTFVDQCYQESQAADGSVRCTSVPGHTELDGACQQAGTQPGSPLCYTTWYNEPDESCLE